MVATRVSVICLLAICLTMSLAVAAKTPGLTGSLEAFRVVLTEEGSESYYPADKAGPEDIIEYRLTYENAGDQPVRNVLITDDIPQGMQYIVSSASQPSGTAVEFSVDGGQTYHSWPVKITRTNDDGEEELVEATPDMVTHVRWLIQETFEPKVKITVSYRTQIK